jgi:hypothetical protein
MHQAGFADLNVPGIPQVKVSVIRIEADQLTVGDVPGLPVPAFDPSADVAADVFDLTALIFTHRSILGHGFIRDLWCLQFLAEFLLGHFLVDPLGDPP